MDWVLMLGLIGWVFFLVAVALGWESRRGLWTGEVLVLLESTEQWPCYDGRLCQLRSYDRVRAFRLLGVLPGRCPGIKIQENMAGGQPPCGLPFQMEWWQAPDGQPYLDVVLPEPAGQAEHCPRHELTLLVKMHERAELAEFTVVWWPLEVIEPA